jgi:hypothetical protein
VILRHNNIHNCHGIYYVASDTIEIRVVTHGNVLLRYHGHEINKPFPGYRHLSIVAMWDAPTTSIKFSVAIAGICLKDSYRIR